MGDKGLSHIEFVITFVIFVAFILFAFVFFNPLQSNRTLESSLDYLEIEVSDFAKTNLETYSVVISSAVLDSEVTIKIDGIPNNFNASVEGTNGNIIPSYIDSTAVSFSRPIDNFVRIKYSSTFENGPIITGGVLLDMANGDYQISSSKSEELYFEKLLLDLNKSYFSNYTGLKKQFNLPNRVNFGFGIKFNETYEILSIKEIPGETEVLSKNDRIQVVHESGIKGYADLRVLVW